MRPRIAGRTLINRLIVVSTIVLGAVTAAYAQPMEPPEGISAQTEIGAATPSMRGKYFGAPRPGNTPVPFAPKILASLSPWVEATAFSPDGKQAFLSVGSANYGSATLYYSKRENGKWTPFEKAPFVSDFVYSNEPVFSKDGATLFFTGKKVAGSLDLWRVDHSDQGWGTPVALPPPINGAGREFRGSFQSDGTLYFGSNRSGMMQIYKAYADETQTWVAEELGAPVNTRSFEGDPCIDPDGHFLIFYSGRDGLSTDLYVSFRDEHGEWGDPINLGDQFNSPYDEYGAHLSSDGKYLFFTRHTSEGNGIYWVSISAVKELELDGQASPAGAPNRY